MSDYKQLPLQFPPETISIPLSKASKANAGLYEAIVSIEDKDLADLNWRVDIDPRNPKGSMYVLRTHRADGKRYDVWMHRVILERVLGYPIPEGMSVDHIDGDGLNNARPNLRLATTAQNQANAKKRADNKSGYKGVSWHKQHEKWRSTISINGKIKHLGYFDTPELAYQAVCKAREKYHGDYANHGESDES